MKPLSNRAIGTAIMLIVLVVVIVAVLSQVHTS